MKYRSALKSISWKFLIGFTSILIMISGVPAADIGMAVLIDSPVQTHTKFITKNLRSPTTSSEGAQGPLRTDILSDKKPKVDSEMVRNDLASQRYPMTKNVGIP